MEIWGLDENYETVKYMPYLSRQWKRRYYETGQFALEIMASEYDPAVKYLWTPERPEMAMVQKVQTKENIKGKFVDLTGFFMEKVLDRQITYPHIKGDYTLKSLAELFLTKSWYKPDIYDIQLGNVPEDPVSVCWESKMLGMSMQETLKTMEMGHRITFDRDTFTYSVYKGVDRTQTQEENSYALFSEDSPHVSELTYTEDESDYKNVALVMYGSDTAGNPYREDVYREGWEQEGRRWLLVNSGGESRQEAIQTGLEELEKYNRVENAKVNVIQNADGLLYMRDYDLGDKCDVVSHTYQHSLEARIVSIDEVEEGGQLKLTLGFGEGEKTIYQKMMRYVTTDRLAHRE